MTERETEQRRLMAEAEQRLEQLGADWLDARVRGHSTERIDADLETARRDYRRAEGKVRQEVKRRNG